MKSGLKDCLLLGVWSRDEVTRVGFKYSRIFLPRLNKSLVRRFPSQRFEVLGKVKGTHKGQHMRFQALQVKVMKGLDGGFLDGAVHALGLPVCPRVIRLCELVDDCVFVADPAKDVHPQKGVDGLVTVLGQVGKGHAVVGEDGVDDEDDEDCVGEGFDHAAQEICTIHLSHVIPEFNIGELGNPVNGQKHVELALSQTQLGNVDMHIANVGRRKLAPPGGSNLARRQPRNAIPEQASMQA